MNNQVLFDKPTYEKLMSEVPKYKMITPSVLADRLRVRYICYYFVIRPETLFSFPVFTSVD